MNGNSESIILSEIRDMLFDEYPNIEITMETNLEFGDGPSLDMTSLDIVRFIIDLENKYDIIIDVEDRYYTIGDVVRGVSGYIDEKIDREGKKDS